MRYTFDSREVRPGMGFVALRGANADGRAYIPQALAAGAAEIVEGLEQLQDKARRKRRTLRATVIGVTGSAGKTTTKELLRAMLSQVGKTWATEGNFNNHIGLPLTVLNAPDDADFLVLEMGSNHPGEIAALCGIAMPDVGVVTNVGTAHLEFFGTREGVAAEKGELLRRASRAFASAATFAFAGCAVEPAKRVEVGEPPEWLRAAVAEKLPGAHNAANAALAYAVAAHCGCTPEKAKAALAGLALPGARWRRTSKGGVDFVDDTYNANPDAMVAALDAFAALPHGGRKIAVLGDMFELGEAAAEMHRRVFAHAMELGLDRVLAVGGTSSRCPCHRAFADVGSLAREFAGEVASGDLVLLKASHSMRLGDLIEKAGLGDV